MTPSILRADSRSLPLPDASVDLAVTSPPYFALRSYTDGGEHYEGQLGSEATPAEYVANLLDCTREWVRVLKPSGSIWVNLGDKYATADHPNNLGGQSALNASSDHRTRRDAHNRRIVRKEYDGIRQKSLLGLPWRYALACVDQLGLILRAEVIWSKPNGLPESVTDRVRRSHEQWFHFTVQPRYFSAVDEIRETYAPDTAKRYAAGYNPRKVDDARPSVNTKLGGDTYGQNAIGKLPGSVWEIASQPLTVPKEIGVDHFAAFPMEWPRRIILGWSPADICTACGEGRRPVVDRSEKAYLRPSAYDHEADRWAQNATANPRKTWANTATLTRVTGYACACPEPIAETRPAVVLDPFGGTGTTALVASALGRHGISVDRSADYCRIAQWRVNDPGQRASAMQVDKPEPVHRDQLELEWEMTA